ncbi:MAG TPA: calcium-binding protein, partial [Allosphingosinicella sp.]|nr:calcium-binding protein [Allosphingosinicella sp.]
MADINGTSGDDSLSTGPGASVVHGLGGNDYIYDTGFFSDYADELYGDDGNDQIYAWGGDDLLFGGAGDDILAGGFGADTLDGGDDSDSLIDNQAGGDTLRGGAGDDLITVSHPTSPTLLGPLGSLTTIEGGSGDDRIELNYSRTPETSIDAGDGDDHVRLTRSAGIVTLTLGAGSDTIELARDFGGWPFTGLHITDYGADDRIIGLSEALFYAIGPWDGVANPFGTGQLRLRQSGADTLLERNFLGTGDSWDTILSFDNTDAASLTAARLDGFDPTGAAAAPQALDGTGAGEDLYGGQGDDVVHGNDGDDVLTGNAGNDSLYGGEGDDTLVGGVGTDLLDGGAGNDDFTVTANGADDVIGGDGDDTLFYRRDDRNFFGYPIAGGTSYVDMGAGNDQLTIHNFAGELIVDAGAGDDSIYTLGYGYQLTLGAGADSISFGFVANTLTVTDFDPAEDRFTFFSSFLRQETDFVSGDPYALGFIRLVQQGADTAIQLASFTINVFSQTPVLLLGVDARTLNAANLGGYAPDGIWAFGTSADDVLAGGTGIDRLSDDQGGSDTLDGGAGNDILAWSRTAAATGASYLAGGAGDDRIDLSGGSAAGTVFADGGADNDSVHLASILGSAVVTLGAGEDTITLDAAASGIPAGSAVAITDFATGAGGDALALTPFLTAWLTGWNPADNPFATGHARLAQSGTSTLLQFDRDGGGNAWTTALTLENTDAADFTAANLGGWDSGTFGNRAPTLAAGPGAPASYYEGDPAVRIAPQATLADADSPDFAGGTLTVTLAGAVADDLVAIRSDGASGIGVAGGVVSYFGTAIGTVSGGAGAANLIVSLNADANSAAVEALIQNLIYVGTTDAMIAGQRVLTVALTDGDGGAAQIVSQFSAHAVNDAPTIAGLAGDTAHYTEGGAAVLLDVGAAALVADADSANFAGGTLTVAITANLNPNQDMLGVQAGGRLGVYGNQIAIDGFVFASSDGGWPGSDLVFTFNEAATPAAVSLLVQALTYFNFDGVTPSAATRTVTLTLTDGDGTDLGGTDTRVATVQVEVAAINEAPELTAPPEPIVYYNEDGPFVGLFGGVYLGDAEFRAGYGGGSLTLSVSGGSGAIGLPSGSLFQAVANGSGFDLVFVNGAEPPVLVGRIAGLGTASVVVDSFAPVQATIFSYLVSSFIYSEAGDAPSAVPRTATLTFNDGGNGNGTGAESATVTQAIQIVAQNDRPTLDGADGGALPYIVNAAAAPLFAAVTIADPDQPGSFAGGSLELTTGGIGARLVLLGSRFAAQDIGGGSEALTDTVTGLQIGIMSRGPGSLTVALGGGATPEAVTALARSFGFQAVGEDASLGTRGVFMTLYDGGHDGAGGSLASNSVSETVDVRTDWLTGTAGDDVLAGTPGADKFDGGAGNDTYLVDNALDRVVEAEGAGRDAVYASVSYELAPGSEFEILSTASQAGTAPLVLVGNEFGQFLYGNAGANYLDGGSGNDTLVGFGGDDSYVVDDASDFVAEFAGGG